MNVQELIDSLEQIPVEQRDAEVKHLWDGYLYTTIEHVYIGKTGICVTADYGEVAYSDSGRPVDAPSEYEARWETPEDPANFKYERMD